MGAWGTPCSRAPARSFTLIEILVVIGIIVILASLLLPTLHAHFEAARLDEAKSQVGIVGAALELYKGAFGDYPPSSDGGAGTNAGIEVLLAHLLTTQGDGPFIQRDRIERWLADTDGDGRQELVDPWRNPCVYFQHSDYTAGAVYYRIKGGSVEITPVAQSDNKDVFENHAAYQLWACGPNGVSESGGGDDIGNVGKR